MERTLIIDNIKENFELQKENGIKCRTWKGNEHDRELVRLKKFLTKMALERTPDVRPHITAFKNSLRKRV